MVLGAEAKNLAELMLGSIERHGGARAVTYKDKSGRWVGHDYTLLGELSASYASGLAALGMEAGSTLAILASTRPEWTYIDLAAISAGVIVAPIYQTSSPSECEYILRDSGASTIVVENEDQLAKIREIFDNCPKLENVILMEGTADDAMSLVELVAKGTPESAADVARRRESLTADDVFTVIYTSGTTGPPKGCVITHGNYLAMLDMVDRLELLRDDDVIYLFLPLAHAMALLIQLVVLQRGMALAYWTGDPQRILDDIAEIRPTLLPSVPRIFEKIHATAHVSARAGLRVKRNIFYWAIRVGKEVREIERAGDKPGLLLRCRHRIADRLVLRKIRALFGGRLRFAVSGAAPINPEILRFFDAAGVLVLEGWGLTECSPAASLSTPEAYKFGSIGQALPGCEIVAADDGELLVRGGNVFQGYLGQPSETAEVLIDGWLHTGDLGEIDDEGFVTITGRKKDIIITAGGKNISPSNIETEIRRNPLVSECLVIGDRRPYLVALVAIDPEQAATFLGDAEEGAPVPTSIDPTDGRLRGEIERWIEKVNAEFAPPSRVRKFELLSQNLSIDDGTLTPTLKVKRSEVAAQHINLIEKLYASSDAG